MLCMGQGWKIDNLIRCLANYKSQIEFRNKDFNADKVKMYKEVRKYMAQIYVDETKLIVDLSITFCMLFDAFFSP